MSFSGKLKNELCQARLDGSDAKRALLGGLVFSIGRSERGGLAIGSESSDVVKLALKLIKSGFEPSVKFHGDENSPFSNKKIYELFFIPSDRFISEVYCSDYDESEFIFDASIGYFLRGIFLGIGSVTDPKKAYHLELVFKDERKADWVCTVLRQRYHLNAKVVIRKKSHVCYIKEAEHISDFLTIIGSVSSLLDFENTRAYKQVVNKINRTINCDTANINKVTDAAMVQVEAIKKLKDSGLLSKLGEKSVEIAELRLKNPELSLTELGLMVYPPITKSGCNHRMKKIIEESRKISSTVGSAVEIF